MEHAHIGGSDSDDPLAHCRELLDDDAADFTDEAVESALLHADALARVIVELVVQHRSSRS